jgi:ATP/maltotriose-dependent transcriptional regulator MalT
MGQFGAELSEAVLASAQGQFEEAELHLATMTSIGREFVPRGQAPCVIAFAKVALDRGDYARASRLLAAVNSSVGPGERPFRSIMDALVHAHCTGILQEVLDADTACATQAEGVTLSLNEALDAELNRSRTTAAQ